MIKKYSKSLIMALLLISILLITNISYAGFFPIYEHIELELKNYNNNQVIVKDKDENILTTNKYGLERLSNGTGNSGSLIVKEGQTTIIDNLYSAAQDVENDYLPVISIEITNNDNTTSTISCVFEERTSKYIYITYDCESNAVIKNIERNEKQQITHSKLFIEGVIIISIITFIILLFILKDIKIIINNIKKRKENKKKV